MDKYRSIAYKIWRDVLTEELIAQALREAAAEAFEEAIKEMPNCYTYGISEVNRYFWSRINALRSLPAGEGRP